MKIDNTMELTNYFKKTKVQHQIEIQPVAMKIISWRTTGRKKKLKSTKIL
jgi:predicted RNA-binding protein